MKTLVGTRDGYTVYEMLECEDEHCTVEALIIKDGIETRLSGHDGIEKAHRLFTKKLDGSDYNITTDEFAALIADTEEEFDY